MKRKSYQSMQCPIARTLECVGEWWSILILRDAMTGLTRFDQFQDSLGISPNILSRRLKGLVENGFLERRMYSESPPRMEYCLTPRGHAFGPILMCLNSFGNRHFADDGLASVLVARETGIPADLQVVDRRTGREVSWPEFVFVPGPAANEAMRSKLAFSEAVVSEGLAKTS
ncbi:winged helix-turn-helix transcriptional regulator [Paraburkholderia sp. D1E]|uniref:winged helix-turn-helix transcriptional regulator n=1 Tax=Paraburkholderia sp. D1E TaxID=3461398 RepID=UPI0040454FA8